MIASRGAKPRRGGTFTTSWLNVKISTSSQTSRVRIARPHAASARVISDCAESGKNIDPDTSIRSRVRPGSRAARPLLPQHDRAASIKADDVERILANIDAHRGNGRN